MSYCHIDMLCKIFCIFAQEKKRKRAPFILEIILTRLSGIFSSNFVKKCVLQEKLRIFFFFAKLTYPIICVRLNVNLHIVFVDFWSLKLICMHSFINRKIDEHVIIYFNAYSRDAQVCPSWSLKNILTIKCCYFITNAKIILV